MSNNKTIHLYTFYLVLEKQILIIRNQVLKIEVKNLYFVFKIKLCSLCKSVLVNLFWVFFLHRFVCVDPVCVKSINSLCVCSLCVFH